MSDCRTSADVRLDRDQATADADDGDAGHVSVTYIVLSGPGTPTRRLFV